MNEPCAVCGSERIIKDCEYYRAGKGAVCIVCCEKCNSSEPFPCTDYDKRHKITT
jgi:hypothetical protein